MPQLTQGWALELPGVRFSSLWTWTRPDLTLIGTPNVPVFEQVGKVLVIRVMIKVLNSCVDFKSSYK